jgi:hypothetical protein
LVQVRAGADDAKAAIGQRYFSADSARELASRSGRWRLFDRALS